MPRMKYAWLFVAVLGWILAGCGNVVEPEEFLYTYRTGARSGAPVSPGGAVYAGQQDGYHVLKLRRSGTPSDQFANVTDRDRTLRCRADQLPADFPRGFPLLGMDAFESSEETRDHVRLYLHYNKSAAPRPTRQTSSEEEWSQAK